MRPLLLTSFPSFWSRPVAKIPFCSISMTSLTQRTTAHLQPLRDLLHFSLHVKHTSMGTAKEAGAVLGKQMHWVLGCHHCAKHGVVVCLGHRLILAGMYVKTGVGVESASV